MLDQLFKAVGFGLCHQLPERSYFAGGFQLPVCARDTGIYLGFALGLLALRILAGRRRPSELPRWPVLVLVGIFVVSMGIDGVSSYGGWRETTNTIRLVTGMLTGWGLAALTFPMVNAQLWVDPGPDRVPEGLRQTALWLLLLAGSLAIAQWVLPLTGAAYPILVTVAILLTFGTVNLVFVALVPTFERRARRLRDAWVAILAAQGLTLLELAGAGWLRSVFERLLG